MAVLVTPDGKETKVQPRGKRWGLEELQEHVGGYIEKMPGVEPTILFDEDGKRKNLPFNAKATQRVNALLEGQVLRYIPQLVGNVLFLEPGEKL